MNNKQRCIAAALALPMVATAAPVLNTMEPTDGLEFGYPLMGNELGAWQMVALPFTVPRSGVITQVETGLLYASSEGAGPSALVITDQLNYWETEPVISELFCIPKGGDGPTCPSDTTLFSFSEPISFSNLAVPIQAGDYFLLVHVGQEAMHWQSNPEHVSPDWWNHEVDTALPPPGSTTSASIETGWETVGERGPLPDFIGGDLPMPAARVTVIPEPGTATLLVLGLVGLWRLVRPA